MRTRIMPRCQFKKRRQRKQSGIGGFIELFAFALFIVVLALLGLDVCMAIFGASINDNACRDATRAATAADNKPKALNMAKTALKAHSTDGRFITQPSLVSLDYQDWNGAPPPDTSPYVSVTTETTVSVPAPIFFFGATFIKDGKAQFFQKYTFPIVKAKFLKYP